MPEGSGLEVCMMAGATENPEFQGTSLETLRHMVSAGMGVTLMPYFSVYPNSGSNPPLSYLHFEDPVLRGRSDFCFVNLPSGKKDS